MDVPLWKSRGWGGFSVGSPRRTRTFCRHRSWGTRIRPTNVQRFVEGQGRPGRCRSAAARMAVRRTSVSSFSNASLGSKLPPWGDWFDDERARRCCRQVRPTGLVLRVDRDRRSQSRYRTWALGQHRLRRELSHRGRDTPTGVLMGTRDRHRDLRSASIVEDTHLQLEPARRMGGYIHLWAKWREDAADLTSGWATSKRWRTTGTPTRASL